MNYNRPLIEITITSQPIVAKVNKLSTNWTFKEGRSITGIGTEYYYYETAQMSDDVTRFYARDGIAKKLPKDKEVKRMKWLKRKLMKKEYDWTILREGSNFFDVIPTSKLKVL